MNSEAGGVVDAEIVQKALDALTEMRKNKNASYQTDMGKFKLSEIDVDTQRVFDKLDELEKSTATSAVEYPNQSSARNCSALKRCENSLKILSRKRAASKHPIWMS